MKPTNITSRFSKREMMRLAVAFPGLDSRLQGRHDGDKSFYQLGLSRRNVVLRVIYLDAILYFLGGLIGFGHHWYFTGQSNFSMARSAMFSVLEVVPLTLLPLDAWNFMRTTRGHRDAAGTTAFEPTP